MKTITVHAGETITLGDHTVRFVKHCFHLQDGQRVQAVELEVEGPDEDAAVDDAGQ